VLVRVKGGHDVEGGKDTLIARAWAKRMEDPNREPLPDGKAYADEIAVGDTITIAALRDNQNRRKPEDHEVTAVNSPAPGKYAFTLDNGEIVYADRNDKITAPGRTQPVEPDQPGASQQGLDTALRDALTADGSNPTEARIHAEAAQA
jgi:hypothetical protein